MDRSGLEEGTSRPSHRVDRMLENGLSLAERTVPGKVSRRSRQGCTIARGSFAQHAARIFFRQRMIARAEQCLSWQPSAPIQLRAQRTVRKQVSLRLSARRWRLQRNHAGSLIRPTNCLPTGSVMASSSNHPLIFIQVSACGGSANCFRRSILRIGFQRYHESAATLVSALDPHWRMPC